jgi:dTDP-4-amino-4,6-dideoxygalactose transaminase
MKTYNVLVFPCGMEIANEVINALNKVNIFLKNYFYLLLDPLHYIDPKQSSLISRYVSCRILCLPIYAELNKNIIKQTIKN